MENKDDGNENKIIFGDLIVLWIKWIGMMKIKHKEFIDAVPIMPVKTQPFTRIQDRRSLY